MGKESPIPTVKEDGWVPQPFWSWWRREKSIFMSEIELPSF
jgi:hypothetical protein